jgi:hypothetical protein
MTIHGELEGIWKASNCELVLGYEGFEVLTAVVINIVIFCDIAPCSL